jgi:hypothetical protein
VSATSKGGGVTGGEMVGYGSRMTDLVLGLETDLNASNLSSTTIIPRSEPDTVRSQMLADGSPRLRAGHGLCHGRPRLRGHSTFVERHRESFNTMRFGVSRYF